MHGNKSIDEGELLIGFVRLEYKLTLASKLIYATLYGRRNMNFTVIKFYHQIQYLFYLILTEKIT